MQEGNANTPLISVSISESSIAAVESKMTSVIKGTLDSGAGRASIAAQAALYHLQSGGNRTRARFCLHACVCLGVSNNDALILSACVELLHNASLIHDDLQDQEKTRHGISSVWSRFSPAIAICAGDLLISGAYALLASISNVRLLPSLMAATHQCVSRAIHGQCDDLDCTDLSQTPFETYARIVKLKSGALLSLPLELALIASENFISLNHARKAAEDFSVGYQIADDLLDIEQDSATGQKPASLNIFFVIQNDAGPDLAKETASSLGRSHFASAHHLAGKLPKNSGHYLQKLSAEMTTFL